MKRYTVIICVLCLLLSFGMVFGGELPAPFQKVKDFALQVEPDKDGDQLITMKDNGITFIMGLFASDRCLALTVTDGNEFLNVCYYPAEDNFTTIVFMGPMPVEIPIEREQGFEIAFMIYREMVKRNLIPPPKDKIVNPAIINI